MKVIKCEKGHFYDSDKYEECPHCKNGLKKYKKEDYDNVDYKSMMTQFSNRDDSQDTILLPDNDQTIVLDIEDTTEEII